MYSPAATQKRLPLATGNAKLSLSRCLKGHRPPAAPANRCLSRTAQVYKDAAGIISRVPLDAVFKRRRSLQELPARVAEATLGDRPAGPPCLPLALRGRAALRGRGVRGWRQFAIRARDGPAVLPAPPALRDAAQARRRRREKLSLPGANGTALL